MPKPTVHSSSTFNAGSDAMALRNAMKGLGSDKHAIIEILGRRTFAERHQIKLKYLHSYGKDLEQDIKKELRGRLEDVILALLTPLPYYLANEIHKAIRGLGTTENILVEILCSSDNRTLREIEAAYQSTYKKSLQQDLKGDTSGDFKHLLVSLATANREENGDTSDAKKLAEALYAAGEKKRFGTDEAEFNRIICTHSYAVLRQTFDEYKKITGKSFELSIQSETSGCFRDGLLAIYYCIYNRAFFFAKELHNAMEGLGTKDNALIRIIVSRSEIDMADIKDVYYEVYEKRLEDAIDIEVSSDYKKILLTLIQE